MSILVNHEIEAFRRTGQVVIEPFVKARLNTNSYDVTLGRYIAKVNEHLSKIDLNSADSDKVFTIKDLGDDGVLVLGPFERVLAHTNEFVGGREFITTSMHARSSWGRWGMQACGCAGLGDVGYYNRYTAEIVNLNGISVRVAVGTVFAQIVFHEVTPPTAGTSYDLTGQYQEKISSLDELQKAWVPEMMLPKPLR